MSTENDCEKEETKALSQIAVSCRLISGFQDTRTNKEDFALTPYLFGVWVNGKAKVRGIGICWGYYSIFVALGFNIPKNLPIFRVIR